jgi:hypothetical protein
VLGVMSVEYNTNFRSKYRAHCNSDKFFDLFTMDRVGYESRKCGTYPHQYFVNIGGMEYFCITAEKREQA